MADDGGRARLGRGLAALLGDVADAEPVRAGSQKRVPVEFLRPNSRNPRQLFASDDLDELAASIRERGIIQPIVARPMAGLADAYEIIAGERRWRAAQRAGLHDVPVVVLEADDKTALELAIVENVQRVDLNVLEEAAGYERLISDYSYSQTDIATMLGKSRSHVANTLRLMKLPPTVRDLVARGELTAGHARALLAVANPEAVARQIIEDGLNVREVERIAQGESAETNDSQVRKPRAKALDPNTRALENSLETILGLAVKVALRADGGEVRIRYSSLEQLDDLCARLKLSAAA